MSTPSFHQHFRQLAGMSPLRYQKWLRLNEARRLMLKRDACYACYGVWCRCGSAFYRWRVRCDCRVFKWLKFFPAACNTVTRWLPA
ncbi:AraC family transcriptional regulator [Enterobacter asburiae]|nr:AraC family transcriptional regulator [Enterobacter asburiae]MCK6837170.1 AraC family transcriptional regulator [Enterobacter asburiae]